MFRTYTAMVLCIVAALVLYFMSATRGRLLENGREELERISGEALAYTEGVEQIADYLHRDLYRSQAELEDLLQYFRLEPEEYQQYSLRRYISSEELVYKSVFYFMNQAFEAYSQLEKIELVSYETRQLTECRPENIVFPGKDGQARLAQIQNQEYCVPGKLVYVKEVREMNTMEPAGCMVFTFEAEQALEKIRSFSPFAEMAVVFGGDQVIFQSPEGADYALRLEDRHYFVRSQSAGEYQIHAFLDERQAARLPWTTFLAILAAGAAAGVIGIFFVDYYAKRFAGRVEAILDAMNQVTTGDFQVRLETGKKEDELDMIADNFNGMCEKLELYIEKSYLEEIERKNAQMQALQSQINPHFLYNTLEAIRMKAICNGDREVGKMLYSMVVLFRSQLKEADVITLGQELDYCKQYLELFEYRYQGCFRSEVECPAELLSLPIIKFVLQPVMENYFIHGIERERQDNLVQVRGEKKGDTLFLYVKDNGRGMEPEKLAQMNRELRENVKTERRNGQKLRENAKTERQNGQNPQENAKAERQNEENPRKNAKAERQNGENPRNKPESGKGREPQEQAGTKKRNESIGIHNVNRRLKAVYGEKYGIYLEAVQPKGLMVVLMAKAEEDAGKDRVGGCAEEGEEHEKGNVS